jgi:hypothetical protein
MNNDNYKLFCKTIKALLNPNLSFFAHINFSEILLNLYLNKKPKEFVTKFSLKSAEQSSNSI